MAAHATRRAAIGVVQTRGIFDPFLDLVAQLRDALDAEQGTVTLQGVDLALDGARSLRRFYEGVAVVIAGSTSALASA